MQVQFWGTRGSIPKPGPTTARYGGNTSCVEVRTARGTLVIIDCGTGLHGLGLDLMARKPKMASGHILVSHTHWDHIQGFPFFVPFFVPGGTWEIYGPKGLDQSLRETLAGQMQHTYFPIAPDQFGATLRYHDLLEGTFEIDDLKITTQYLNHPALTLGYRLEADGATLVYCCDHEPFSRAAADGQGEFAGQDRRHARFIEGADLLIHDAQYTAAEYPSRIGWGHSPGEFVVRLARLARVKQLALTHHDPLRSDDALDQIVEQLRTESRDAGSSLEIFAAAEGRTIAVKPSGRETARPAAGQFQAMTPLEPSLAERSIILGVSNSGIAAALVEASRAEGIRAHLFSDAETARALIARDRPSLAIIEHDATHDGMALCRAIRQADGEEMPVVMVARQQDTAAGATAGVTDWLITPFTESYARTKIRAWVLRTACRWITAAIPDDEEQRIASLRDLKILDTDPDERFDRITRLATALFDVPISTITLIDENRQWFKSCVGLGKREDPRDVSFCAHAVHGREPMVVEDTFHDGRFADNPLVIDEPRIRFYAGYPLILDDGRCIGTLCLIDTRPRMMQGTDLGRLRDLADLAMQEIRRLSG
jgi:phosphoribosyl 1,2-cyclic phosphodiesterase/CheY-like chemotaxis protein